MKGHYAYLSARVKAKSSLLLKQDDYSKLLQVGFSDIAKYLGESQYKQEIDSLAVRYSGAELVERALNRNLANTMDTIIRISSGKTRAVLRDYLSFWEVENIKTLLRAKYANTPAEDIADYLLPVRNYAQLTALAAEPTIEDIIEKLDPKYRSILEEPLSEYRTTKNLMLIENALDKCALMNMTDVAKRAREKTVTNHIRLRIDLINLTTIIRLKHAGAEDMEQYIIPGGKEKTEKLIKTPLNEIGSAIETPLYREAVKNEMDNGMTAVESALENAYMRESMRLARAFPLSLSPVLGYVVKKENEVKNIRSIVRGREKGFSTEEIQQLIVI